MPCYGLLKTWIDYLIETKIDRRIVVQIFDKAKVPLKINMRDRPISWDYFLIVALMLILNKYC